MSARQRRAKKARARRRRRIASRSAAVSGGLAVALAAPATPAAGSATTLVKDIDPGSSGGNPLTLANIGGTLYFDANDGSNGYELWKSDGSGAGTSLVKDIRPGPADSLLLNLTNAGGTLYFRANDGSSGNELWKSDGTTAGTTLVEDIRPGSLSSNPFNLTDVGGSLYFGANDGSSGYELRKSDSFAPETTIDSGPADGAMITTDAATYAFHGTTGDTAKLQCSLDGAAFADCTSPHTFSALADGPHTVAFRAIDDADNTDQTPASRTLTVDTSPDNAFTAPKKGKANTKKGTLALTVTLPGPGLLEADQAAKGKAGKLAALLLRRGSKALINHSETRVAGAGAAKITIKPSKAGLKKLKKKARGKKTGKLKVAVDLTFTPDGGDPNTESRSYSLRLK